MRVLFTFLLMACASLSMGQGLGPTIKIFIKETFQKKEDNITQNIRGLVVDQETRQPLTGASILLDSTQYRGTHTDDHGNFILRDVLVGRHSLRVSHVGYKDEIISVLVSSAWESVLDISMEVAPFYLTEVSVQNVDEPTPIGGNLIRTDELNRHAGNRGEAIRKITTKPGITNADDSRNDVVIRGNSPQSVQWRLEGVNLPNPNHFNFPGTSGGPVAIINDRMLATSAFYSGAFPAQYGNTISGIFDLSFRPGNTTKNNTSLQFSLLGAEASTEGPFNAKNKSSYLVLVRKSTIGLFHDLGIDIGTEAIPKYTDLSFKLNFPARNGASLSFFGMGGISDVDIVISNQEDLSFLYGERDRDQYFSTDMGIVGLVYKKPMKENGHLSMTVAGSGQWIRSHHDFAFPLDVRRKLLEIDEIGDDKAAPDLQWYNFTERRLSASFFYTKRLKRANYFHAGMSGDVYFLHYKDFARNIGVDISQDDFGQWRKRWWDSTTALLFEPFIQYKHVGNKIDLLAGLHSQVFTLSNSVSWVEPRVSVQYHHNEKTRFNVGLGLHSQTNQLNLYFYGNSNDLQGNPTALNKRMDFARSIHTSLGVEKLLVIDSPVFRIKAEVYYQYLYNVPVEASPSAFSLINTGADFRRIFPETTLVNNGNGYNYGFELTLEKAFSHGYLFLITGSLFESKYRGSDNVLRDTDFNSNYIMNALFTREWSLKNQNVFSVGSRFTTAGGRTYGPVNTEQSVLRKDVVYIKGQENTLRFDPYNRLDVRLSYKINRACTSHELVVDIINILNIKNVLKLAYIPNKESGGTVDKQYQLGTLPFFSYRVEF